MGFGSGAIDAALNTYAARNFTPKHMSWLHAAYAAGATAGPAIMTAVLSRGGSWRVGYGVVGSLLAALVVAFVASRKLWAAGERPEGEALVDAPVGTGPVPLEERPISTFSALRSGRVWLQIVIFFFYTGIEVSAGQWSYTIPQGGPRAGERGGGDVGRGVLGWAVGGAAGAGLRGRAGGAGADAAVRDGGGARLGGDLRHSWDVLGGRGPAAAVVLAGVESSRGSWRSASADRREARAARGGLPE